MSEIQPTIAAPHHLWCCNLPHPLHTISFGVPWDPSSGTANMQEYPSLLIWLYILAQGMEYKFSCGNLCSHVWRQEEAAWKRVVHSNMPKRKLFFRPWLSWLRAHWRCNHCRLFQGCMWIFPYVTFFLNNKWYIERINGYIVKSLPTSCWVYCSHWLSICYEFFQVYSMHFKRTVCKCPTYRNMKCVALSNLSVFSMLCFMFGFYLLQDIEKANSVYSFNIIVECSGWGKFDTLKRKIILFDLLFTTD